jgi:murein DD-endopeptidase MepM/ murein hydrolase activator NlpD
MKSTASDISTVIIVNKGRERTQTLQIKTRHISRFRYYTFGIIAVVVSLAASVVYLKTQNRLQEIRNLQLTAQLNKLNGNNAAGKDATLAKPVSAASYIQAIQEKLQIIDKYLRKRGLKGFTTDAVGGNGNAEEAKLTDAEKYSLYDEYLDRLVKTVGYTPMGYPKISSFTSFFGYRSDPFNSANAEFHPGIDFKGSRGDEAKCTANGKVVAAGWYGGYGKCVRIAHGNDLETLYGHLSRISVEVGQLVTAGQKIGEIGSTGHSTGTHLHYEVRKNGKAVNPMKYLSLNN